MSPKKTYHGVFIIESTSELDEEENRQEGKALMAILELAERPVLYRYIRTAKELEKMLQQFSGTTFRYLHLACHGNRSEIALTYDEVRLRPLADLLAPFMNKKRLFLSVCQAAQRPLAEPLMTMSTCNSVVGPADDIDFDDAAIAWASFYILMSKIDPERMVRADIERILKRVCAFYAVSFNAFFRENGAVVMKRFGPRRFPRVKTRDQD
jgi:hypothetical protein